MSPAPGEALAPARAPRSLRRIASRLLQVVLGVAVGAAVAEVGFRVRDDGAFPHLNVFVADGARGVRLRPGAEERVAFNGNPVTRVRINADGFRGDELGPVTPGEILVVGDSQAFGLGVEEGETFSAQLAAALPGRRVLNLGVPTYGPPEYGAVLEDALARRVPGAGAEGPTVVYAVNLAKDLFGATRPNVERHAAWDGWAVRAETAPDQVTWFPGRELLFRQSHAVYALRSLLHRGDETPAGGFASEGTWQDVLGAAAVRKGTGDAGRREVEALLANEKDAQRALTAAALEAYPAVMETREGREYQRTQGNPGDIVVETARYGSAESSRRPDATAKELVKGAHIRKRIEDALRRRAARQIESEQARAVLASLHERQVIEERIAALRASPDAALALLSPLRAPLVEAQALCAARGARLVLLALPIDVEVSPAEWAKYGQSPVDMSDVRALTGAMMATAASLRIPTVDARAALVDAEPGAFLIGDLHLSPKGHRAVATALAAALRAPAAAAEQPEHPALQARTWR